MKRILLTLLGATLMCPSLSLAEKVDLGASPVGSLGIVKAFTANASRFGSRLTVSGFTSVQSLAGAQCDFAIVRPNDRNLPAAAAAGNKLACSLKNKDGSTGSLSFNLSDIPIATWGSPREKSVQFTGVLAKGIYQTLLSMNKTEPSNSIFRPIYGIIDWICAPDGSSCTQSTYVNQHPDEDSPAILICNRDGVPQANGTYTTGNYVCIVLDSN